MKVTSNIFFARCARYSQIVFAVYGNLSVDGTPNFQIRIPVDAKISVDGTQKSQIRIPVDAKFSVDGTQNSQVRIPVYTRQKNCEYFKSGFRAGVGGGPGPEKFD